MSEVEKWSEGVHPLIASTSILWASMLDNVTETFLQLKANKIFEHSFTVKDLPAWSALYQSEKSLIQFMIPMICSSLEGKGAPPNFAENMLSIVQATTNISYIESPGLPPKFNQADADTLCQNTLSITLTDIEQRTSDNSITTQEKTAFLVNETEACFFILVMVPCLVLYQTFPRILYQDALNGDIKALENLLRMDRRILHDPEIGKQLEIIHSKSITVHDKLIKDSLELPKPKITRRRILDAIAGFISALAVQMQQELTEPKIRDLFDSMSRDKNGADDEDLMSTPETFYQAIRRSRKKWLALFETFNPDKKT